MANFVVDINKRFGERTMSTSSLQERYTFWIFKKKSQKVLRCGNHKNGFQQPHLIRIRMFCRLELHPFPEHLRILDSFFGAHSPSKAKGESVFDANLSSKNAL